MWARRVGVIWIVMLASSSSSLSAQYSPSPHDLRLAVAGGGFGDECAVCHVLSSGQPANPAWMASLPSSASYRLYGGATLDAWVQPPDGSSLMCLGCHDGLSAPDIGHAPKSLGTDLSNDHPISFVYDGALAFRDGSLADPGAEMVTLQGPGGNMVTGTIEQLLLEGGKVQCVSCHDVHDRYGNPGYLKIANTGSALCLTCHRK